jgi:hypothetical protein
VKSSALKHGALWRSTWNTQSNHFPLSPMSRARGGVDVRALPLAQPGVPRGCRMCTVAEGLPREHEVTYMLYLDGKEASRRLEARFQRFEPLPGGSSLPDLKDGAFAPEIR